jgi:hypothetical protein
MLLCMWVNLGLVPGMRKLRRIFGRKRWKVGFFFFFKFLVLEWDWGHLVRRPQIDLLYQPRMIDVDEYGVVGGMRIGKGNRSTYLEKPAQVPFCLPQILHHLTWAPTRGAAMESSRRIEKRALWETFMFYTVLLYYGDEMHSMGCDRYLVILRVEQRRGLKCPKHV